MTVESGIIANVGLAVLVVTGILYTLQTVDLFTSADIATLGSLRKRIFKGLVQSSPSFGEFYKILENPESYFETAGNRGYYILSAAPVIILGILVLESFVLKPLNTAVVYVAIPFLVLGYALLTLTLAVALRIRKPVLGLKPSNRYLLAFSYLKGLDTYMFYAFMVLVLSPIRTTSAAISNDPKAAADGFSFFVQNPALIGALLSFPALFFVMYVLFRRMRNRILLSLQDELYQLKFALNPLTIEVTIRSRKGEESRVLRGLLLHIGPTLIIKRDDEYVQTLPWKDVRFVAAHS